MNHRNIEDGFGDKRLVVDGMVLNSAQGWWIFKQNESFRYVIIRWGISKESLSDYPDKVKVVG